MTYWLISANGKLYDHASAFAKWGYIDWRQTGNYSIGDVVYIYCARPYQKIMYKTEVVQESMSFSQCTDDKVFWHNLNEYEKSKGGKYARLKLNEQADRKELSLPYLLKNGLKAHPQGPIKISDELVNYIDHYIEDTYATDFFPECDIPRGTGEGAILTVQVNRYERSSIARRKCIEHYGCMCYICGLNFEAYYGEIGQGFIHVHHKRPLSEIGQEYTVDYKNDLIPVCPNCHAMLHRKLNGNYMTPEKLRQLIKK